jgi:hypothetical protein
LADEFFFQLQSRIILDLDLILIIARSLQQQQQQQLMMMMSNRQPNSFSHAVACSKRESVTTY